MDPQNVFPSLQEKHQSLTLVAKVVRSSLDERTNQIAGNASAAVDRPISAQVCDLLRPHRPFLTLGVFSLFDACKGVHLIHLGPCCRQLNYTSK